MCPWTCRVIGDAGFLGRPLSPLAAPITCGLFKNCCPFACLHRVGDLRSGEDVCYENACRSVVYLTTAECRAIHLL